jgi:luciferase family oxidoreductase group 1
VTSPLILSVLDQSPVRSGATAADAVNETIELAQATERLGFQRYWLAEHHNTEGLAGCAPEIMITRVAAATKTIRVGSGGVMLNHYSPYKLAEVFRLLEVMFPGRIDLGLGRAPGSDPRTAQALAYGSQIGVDYIPTKLHDLVAFVSDGKPSNEVFQAVHATPRSESVPDLWMLGSSNGGGDLAAHFGLGFSFADFFGAMDGAGVMRSYYQNYQPSELYPEPRGNVCVFVLCADTAEEAEELALSRDLWRLRIDKGDIGPYPSVEEARAYQYQPYEQAQVDAHRHSAIIGDPSSVKKQIEAVAKRYGLGDVSIVTITHDPQARIHSYELVAEAFGLTPP